MDPVCFHIGSKPVYWYGIFVALGFLAGVVHWSRRERKAGLPEGFASELAIWIMVGGILGARIAYVAANIEEYAAHPLSVLRIDQGGLIYYGGLIGGTLAVLLLAWRRRIDRWVLGDFVIGALPLGHAFGRIGCFINVCCYGCVTTSPLGVWTVVRDAGDTPKGAFRHPAQLYESGANLAVYALLLWWQRRERPAGSTVALYLLTYPVSRFFVEFLRGDERAHWAGLNVAQWTSIGLFLAGLTLWRMRGTAPEKA